MISEFFLNIESLLRFKTYSELVEDLYLSSLIDSFTRLRTIPNISHKTENQIRNYLAFDLERNNSVLAPFIEKKLLKLTKENTLLVSPTETRRTDIEFFFSGFGDFVVECKNLRSADQRYINEGADRFVRKVYAATDGEAAMLGFVVGGKISSIMSALKHRLEDEPSFVKGFSEPATECVNYKFSFHTSHHRADTVAILLHHMFVDLVAAPEH